MHAKELGNHEGQADKTAMVKTLSPAKLLMKLLTATNTAVATERVGFVYVEFFQSQVVEHQGQEEEKTQISDLRKEEAKTSRVN